MLILIVESYIMHPAKKNVLVRIFKNPVIWGTRADAAHYRT